MCWRNGRAYGKKGGSGVAGWVLVVRGQPAWETWVASDELMKVTVARQEFQEALGAVSALTGGRTTKPILSCVRLAGQPGALELGATDGEAALRLSLPGAAVERADEAVVSAERLLGIVREFAAWCLWMIT